MKSLNEVKCRFDGPQEYYDVLVAESAAGRLPAVSDGGEDEGAACEYLTSDGRQCGVGLLFSPEDAGLLQTYAAGTVRLAELWWRQRLPAWLSFEDASAIQDYHDDTAPEEWHHGKWVKFLNTRPCFAGVNKTLLG